MQDAAKRKTLLKLCVRQTLGLFLTLPGRAALCLPIRRISAARLFHNSKFRNPGVIVWVKPSRIRKRGTLDHSIPPGKQFVIPDRLKWETPCSAPHQESAVEVTMRELLVYGRKPAQTTQYQAMMNAVRSRNTSGRLGAQSGTWWCQSESDVERYFEVLLAACNDISNNQYLTQAELKRARPSDVDFRKVADEIGVVIGADGAIYHAKNGTHRLYAAQHYKIARVPVKVVAVAEEWARRYLQPRFGSLIALVQAAVDSHEPV